MQTEMIMAVIVGVGAIGFLAGYLIGINQKSTAVKTT